MTIKEWWWLYDAKVGEPKVGGLKESEAERLYKMLE
jgi:hypothetical protein